MKTTLPGSAHSAPAQAVRKIQREQILHALTAIVLLAAALRFAEIASLGYGNQRCNDPRWNHPGTGRSLYQKEAPSS